MTAMGQITQGLPYKNVTVSAQSGVAVFQGSALYGKPGQPNLPYYTLTFLLPANADMRNVTVDVENVTERELTGVYAVTPAVPPSTGSYTAWPQGVAIVDGKDIAVYRNNAFFPASNKGAVVFGQLRQYKLVDVTISPYRFNPVTGALKQLTGGRVVVRGVDAVAASFALPAAATNSFQTSIMRQVGGMVANAGNLSTYGQAQVQAASVSAAAPAAGAAGRYVIITTNAIANASAILQDFVASKEAKGFTVQVATESTWGGGTGDAAAEHIRSYLKSHYLADNIAYVLLIGNPGSTVGDVPMKMCWPRSTYTDYPYAETDYYYAELTGNWDLNNNGLYGEERYDTALTEPEGADIYAEVSVGRIPVYNNNMPVLDKILAKCIAYENEGQSEIGWRKNMLLPMEPSDAGTPGWELGEAIKDSILVPAGWNCHRVYDAINGYTGEANGNIALLNPQPETMPCSELNVTTAWTSKPFGAVIWWTHGWSEGAVDIMTSGSVSQLSDDYPVFTFQVSCTNAYPDSDQNLGYSLLRNGAIGTVAATQVSWYFGYQTTFHQTASNAGMSYDFAKYLIEDSLPAGDALNRVRSGVPFNIWMNWLVFNLYGDPSIGIASSGEGLPPKQVAFAVNAGGNAYMGSDAVLYAADSGFVSGNVATTSAPIANTVDAPLYQSERWGASTYSIPNLPSGTYEIKFRFAESYWTRAGARKFDVVAEGQTLISQLDIYASAGGMNKAYDVTKKVNVTDGTLNISFTNATADQPKICAFVVYKPQGGNLAPVANAGANQTTFNYAPVTLDGTASSDPDNGPQPLSYSWSQVSAPVIVELSGVGSATPTFTPYTAGIYTFRLTVNDGLASSSAVVTITVNELQYTVVTAASPAIGGAVSGGGVFAPGSRTYLQATPSAGYAFSGWTGSITGSLNPYLATVGGNMNVTANFVPVVLIKEVVAAASASSRESDTYSAAKAIDGSITTRWSSTFSDPQWIVFDLGSAKAVVAVELEWESANAKNYTLEGSNDATFVTKTTLATKTNMATGDHRIDRIVGLSGSYRYYRMYGTARNTSYGYSLYEARFYSNSNPLSYTITASAGAHGTISPIGNVKVEQGARQTFTMIPDSGYKVGAVVVDGILYGAFTSFTFTNVSGDRTIGVSFAPAPNTYTLTVACSPATAGTVTGGGTYTEGETASLYAIPNRGWSFHNWAGDISGTSDITTVLMDANKTVTAVLVRTSCLITATAAANGTITPSGDRSVLVGSSQTYTIAANTGYVIADVQLDGVSQGAISTYTFENVQEDHTLVASFKPAGLYVALPGRLQAEDYKAGGEGVGYHDLSAGNLGGAYKQDYVDIENCTDAGSGYNVGWIQAGEWLAYDVNVQTTGLYNLTARVASGAAGTKSLSVTVDGATVATLTFTDASGWQSWTDVSLPNIALSAGSHELRIVMNSGAFNLNYLEVAAGGGNLLANGDFSNGLTGWLTSIGAGASASITPDSGAAKIAVTAAGANPWDIQIYQGISLTANRTYTLEFDIKASATPKSFKVVVEHDGAPYTKYHEQQYSVTAAAGVYQHYVITFTPSAGDAQAKLGFHFGSFNTNAVWMDNVVLK
jgi:hypothetical protein